MVYLADHWLIDVLAGIAYAIVAYLAVTRAPAWFRRAVDRAADDRIGAVVDGAAAGDGAAIAGLGRRIRWTVVGQGLAMTAAGAIIAAVLLDDHLLGGYSGPFYLIPSAIALAGLWRLAQGVYSP